MRFHSLPSLLIRSLPWIGWLAIAFAIQTSAQTPGTLDTSFQQNDLINARFFTELSDQKILVSGEALAFSAPKFTRAAIVRLRPNGTVDPDFNFSGDPTTVSGHVLRSDGRILIYGSFTTLNGHATHGVAMLTESGAVDTRFKLEPNSGVGVILVVSAPNGVSYVGYQNGLFLRVDSDGHADPGFKPNPALANRSFGAVLQPSGKIVVVQDSKIFRLNLDGSRDASYTESTYTTVNPEIGHYTSTPEGALYVSTSNRRFAGGEPRTIARVKLDGGLDTDFKFALDGPTEGGRDVVFLARESTGKLLVTGYGMTPSFFRVLPSGQLDNTLTNLITPTAFAFDSTGKILTTGFYLQTSPFLFRNGVMRLANDSTPVGPSKPYIQVQPFPLTVESGSSALFSVVAVGDAPLTYQWQFGDSDLGGRTSNPLKLDSVTSANAGSYRVIISNPIGSITSAPAALTVISNPKILTQPQGFTTRTGIQTNLSVSLTGEAPLQLQWYRNSNPLEGATQTVLEFPSTSLADIGDYLLVISNSFGAVTSSPAKVRIQDSAPRFLVITNATSAATFDDPANPFRPDAALRVASDGPRGSLVLHSRGLERWSDAGVRLWSIRYVEADAGTLSTLAVDPDGNAYVGGMIHFAAKLGEMNLENNSSVTGPNGHVQAFIAKVDPDGKALWYRLYEAAGPRIYGLAIDTDRSVVFAGGSGGRNGLSRLGNLVASESEYAAAVAGKIDADGTPKWFRSFPQFTFNRSSCEADSIVADDSGIYISGLYSYSIRFGNFELQQISPSSSHWIGKLNREGDPQWLKHAGGSASQGASLGVGGGKRWFLNNRDQTLQSWSTNGTPLTTFLAFSPNANTTANLRQLAVTSQGEPILVGNAVGSLNLGGVLLNPGVNQPMVWFGQWDADGNLIRTRILATTTNATPNVGGHTLAVSAFNVTASGDVLAAGSYIMSLRFLGQPFATPTNSFRSDGWPAGSFLAKVQQPARSPEITQQPIATYTLDTEGTVKIGIRATGAEPLSYQWRFNGVPLPGKDTNTLEFIDARFSETGSYDVVVSNAFGQVVSAPSLIIVRPPFNIRNHPASQLVLNSQELSGQSLADLGPMGINAGAIANKTLRFVITNSTSPIFPVGGEYSLTLNGLASGGTYKRPEGAVFPAGAGNYQTLFSIPDITTLRFLRFRDSDSAGIDLLLGARFSIHLDIADPSGCCAQGTFSLAGGTPTATFRVTTSFFVPDGNFQWQHNGKDIPGQTSSVLTLTTVTLKDAGTYQCLVTSKGYSETSQPAELRFLGAPPVVDPPVIPLETFAISPSGMTLTAWPAGFVLQRTRSLSPVQWETIATTPPVSIPFSQPGEFFRLAPAP